MATAIVCIILAIIVFFAVRSIIKKRKSGGCGCGCSGCSGCGIGSTKRSDSGKTV